MSSFSPQSLNQAPSLLSAMRITAVAVCLSFLLLTPGWAQTKPAAASPEKPVLVATVPGIHRGYDDIRFLFQLAGDEKGFAAFKDTLDAFFEGIDAEKPAGARVFVTRDGMQTVVSLPVKSEADFKKFLRNLWDLNVKTAPPPAADLLAQVPSSLRTKLPSLKLQANERIIFGETDGFLRFDAGQVHFGRLLTDVRNAAGNLPAETAKDALLTVDIDGAARSAAQRHEAFGKSRQVALDRLKRHERESEPVFGLRKALAEFELARMELLLCESSRAHVGFTLSREKKSARLEGELMAADGSSLAKDIKQIGESRDEFAGVSKRQTALAASINVPVNAALRTPLKNISKDAREVAKSRIDADVRLEDGQRTTDKRVADLLFGIADDVAALSMLNGFVRIWPNESGTLTTVAAVTVPDGRKYREALQKVGVRPQAKLKAAGEAEIEIHQVAVAKWRNDYAELFDKEGTILIGTAEKAVWFALGEQAHEHLDQSIRDAAANAGAKRESAAEVQAQLLPLVQVWDRIRSRRPASATAKPASAPAKSKPKGESNKSGKSAPTASTLSDLELRKVALEAFKAGNDTVSLTFTREGDKGVFSAQFDEGILRFFGMSLSKFTKEELDGE